nr:hypothetical protein [uncultured Albidiferax sp.]
MTSRLMKKSISVERVELLTVADGFKFNRVGLVLEPDFRVSNNWKNLEELVLVIRPDGTEIEVNARFKVVHFNVQNSVGGRQLEQASRVVAMLLGVEKIAVPRGSRLLVRASTRESLLGASEGTQPG